MTVVAGQRNVSEMSGLLIGRGMFYLKHSFYLSVKLTEEESLVKLCDDYVTNGG